MSVVVFDLLCSQPIGDVQFHGGGEYTKTVFKALLKMRRKEDKIFVCFDKTSFLDSWIIEEVENQTVEFHQVVNYGEIVSFLRSFPDSVKIRFFAGLSYVYQDYVFPENVIGIGTCHGLRYLEKPFDKNSIKYGGLKRRCKEIIRRVLAPYMLKRYRKKYERTITRFSCLITDSNHSAFSLRLNFSDTLGNKEICVFYPLTQPVDRELDNFESPSEGFIMMISANRWIKNSYRGVKALDGLYSKKMLNLRTRVYGNLPQRIRRELKHPEMFDFLGYVSSEELEKGYKNCNLLFYPTLNEGFGNVPMEAMKYGKTCVVSAVCSLPEVYEQSVFYCNPYDIMEMQNRILQAIDHRIDVSKLKARLTELRSRQEQDLNALCKLIVGTTEKKQ